MKRPSNQDFLRIDIWIEVEWGNESVDSINMLESLQIVKRREGLNFTNK